MVVKKPECHRISCPVCLGKFLDGKGFFTMVSSKCPKAEPKMGAQNSTLGGEPLVLDTERTSDDMIQNPDHSYEDRRKFQTIFTEEIEGELISALPGQSTGEKKLKTDILEVVFMTRSWARIKEFSPDLLKKGLGSVKQLCSLLKTNEGVPDGEDAVTWLRGEFLRADDNVPDFRVHA